MTDRELIYLVGAPGAGKSTLMARLTAGYTRAPALPLDYPAPPRDWLLSPRTLELKAIELGRRRERFSGTDALASNVIALAESWLTAQHEAPLVFGEGARLGNRRFLARAVRAGYGVTLALLDHPEVAAWRTARAAEVGRTQNPGWVAGRTTASRNLADAPPPGVRVLRGHPDDLYERLTR